MSITRLGSKLVPSRLCTHTKRFPCKDAPDADRRRRRPWRSLVVIRIVIKVEPIVLLIAQRREIQLDLSTPDRPADSLVKVPFAADRVAIDSPSRDAHCLAIERLAGCGLLRGVTSTVGTMTLDELDKASGGSS